MAEPTPEQIDQLSVAFERFTRRFKVAEAVAAADNALNALDAQTLVFISENAGCNAGEIARYLDVAPTTMTSALDRLVRKGLIERRRPEENRRSVALTATGKGLQAVEDHKAGYRNACAAMLRALDTAEQAQLIRLTEKVTRTNVE
ncbi:MarR family winged helix-turn-helix transcriptional regulator [Sphingomonas sp.]|uniref:MarR family winged helix-turn-helix transcriptional regulator n=1 Tax=Sphingomonas sp. TaxID=28214 RepID=UPI002B6727BE|nr:MarR family transcriptional regulator [Sphingomonas sp.]HTG39374.1 MarR family transcriptional regulator [Sphingomonas sp.]